MSFTILHADGQTSIVVEDNTIDTTSTSLSLVGKNTKGYAKPIAENFLHLLENFASVTPPVSPVVGQLWYDTSASAQLNVWDGSAWVSATNLFKGTSAPVAAQAGALWMDTLRQQLFFFTGTDWILIGPQFSDGVQTGPVSKRILDINNVEHSVIELIIGIVENDQSITQERVAIISFSEFTPKARIPGYTVIRPGINVSSEVSNSVWGTSENSLKLNGIAAEDFLTRTAENTTVERFNIASNSGLTVGTAGNVQLTNDLQNNAVLTNLYAGKSIVLKTTAGNTQVDAVIVSSTGTTINSPATVQGLLQSNGLTIKNNNTTVVTVGNTVNISTDAAVTGTLSASTVTANSIQPSSLSSSLGDSQNKWNSIFATTITADNVVVSGTISGTFSGDITGKAAGLLNSTPITITGDFSESAPVLFSGTGAPISINVSATPDLFNNRGPVDSSSMLFDEILINRANVGLKRVTKSTFIKDLPLIPVSGTIIYPDIGTIPPGFIKCDGAEYQRLSLPVLFNTIGTTYGSTSSSTFKVPNWTAPTGSIYLMFSGEI